MHACGLYVSSGFFSAGGWPGHSWMRRYTHVCWGAGSRRQLAANRQCMHAAAGATLLPSDGRFAPPPPCPPFAHLTAAVSHRAYDDQVARRDPRLPAVRCGSSS